jgi:hypothetical protein
VVKLAKALLETKKSASEIAADRNRGNNINNT